MGTCGRHSSGSSSRGGVGRCCIICLDDEVETDQNALLYDVCECKTTAVHRNCLEELLNSARRRRMPFARRVLCDVCLHAYNIHYRLATIEPLASGMFGPPDIVHRTPAYVRKFDVAAAFSFGVAFFAKVLLTQQLVWPVYCLVALLASLAASHAVSPNLRLRLDVEMHGGAAQRPVDPLMLPDDAFYERVFVRERASLAARSASAEQLRSLEQSINMSSSMQLLIIITPEMAAGSHQVHSPREGVQTREFAPRPSQADGGIIRAASGAATGAAECGDAERVQPPWFAPRGTEGFAPAPDGGATTPCGGGDQGLVQPRAPSVRRAHSLVTQGTHFAIGRSLRRLASQAADGTGHARLSSSDDDERLLPTAVACHPTW